VLRILTSMPSGLVTSAMGGDAARMLAQRSRAVADQGPEIARQAARRPRVGETSTA
jgi:hypothetical protein